MHLYEFTTETNEDGSRIVLARGRVADHPDLEKQKVWIAFQVEVDVPTIRNGAILREAVLQEASGELVALAAHFRQLVDQGH